MCGGVAWQLLMSWDPTSPDLNFATFVDATPIVDLPALVVVQKPEVGGSLQCLHQFCKVPQCSCALLITWKIGGVGGVSEVRRSQARKGNDISGCAHQMS